MSAYKVIHSEGLILTHLGFFTTAKNGARIVVDKRSL